jgi:UDP-4-amino-4,6-dideoxy-N-acetyl-beta-L-altrosamine N-acetyltransferase
MITKLRKNLDIKSVHLKNFINLSQEEKKIVLDWRNSDQTRNGMYSNEEIKWQEHLSFIQRLETDDTRLYFLAFIKENPVGVVYFTGISIMHKRGVYGIYLRPDGQFPPDTGVLLREVILELSFRHMDFNTLNSEVLSDNKLAYIYNRRGGFKEEGRLRAYINRGDRTLDVILFGMLKSEYLEMQNR